MHDMRTKEAGVTLIELLISLAIVGIVMTGIISTFVMQSRLYMSQGEMAEMEDNLRFGADFVADMVRTAGYGVPCDNMDLWLPWMSGFTENPDIVAGPPDAFSVASSFDEPVAELSADVNAGDTQISLDSTSGIDAGSRRLIMIGASDHAHVVSVGGTVTIDTDPTQAGNQGLGRGYLSGTPIRRVDVRTISLIAEALVLDDNQGEGIHELVSGISNFEIDPIDGDRYELTLTGSVEVRAAQHGQSTIEQSLVADIFMRNSNGCNSPPDGDDGSSDDGSSDDGGGDDDDDDGGDDDDDDGGDDDDDDSS